MLNVGVPSNDMSVRMDDEASKKGFDIWYVESVFGNVFFAWTERFVPKLNSHAEKFFW